MNFTSQQDAEPTYWCTFTDESQRIIRALSLSGFSLPEPDAIELLESDPRVQYVLRPPESRCIQKFTLRSLDDLNLLSDLFGSMALYRGQSNYLWNLQTRLERNVPSFVMNESGLEIHEYQVLVEAKRRLHHFLSERPDEDDLLSWLALLRHHGVPTRLLDATRSIFIACYFAIREANPGIDSAIWIFNRRSFNRRFSNWESGDRAALLRQSPFTTSHYGDSYSYYWPFPKNRMKESRMITIESLRSTPDCPWWDYSAVLEAALLGYIEKPGVGIAEPYWLTRRMDVQQGAFLIPFNVRKSFQSNLDSFLGFDEASDPVSNESENFLPNEQKELWRLLGDASVIKVRVPKTMRASLRARLIAMNLRDLTMFPDIEGAMEHISTMVPVEGR